MGNSRCVDNVGKAQVLVMTLTIAWQYDHKSWAPATRKWTAPSVLPFNFLSTTWTCECVVLCRWISAACDHLAPAFYPMQSYKPWLRGNLFFSGTPWSHSQSYTLIHLPQSDLLSLSSSTREAGVKGFTRWYLSGADERWAFLSQICAASQRLASLTLRPLWVSLFFLH